MLTLNSKGILSHSYRLLDSTMNVKRSMDLLRLYNVCARCQCLKEAYIRWMYNDILLQKRICILIEQLLVTSHTFSRKAMIMLPSYLNMWLKDIIDLAFALCVDVHVNRYTLHSSNKTCKSTTYCIQHPSIVWYFTTPCPHLDKIIKLCWHLVLDNY